jgi:hypothetical protein
MCRNNDFIRRVLLELNKTGDPTPLQLDQFTDVPEVSDDSLFDHIEFLVKKDLIEESGTVSGHQTYQLTWDGCDFLGSSKDPILWKAAMQVAGHLTFDAFYVILKDLMLWKARKVVEEYWERENGTKKKR